MTTLFAADHHFNHAGIIKYCNRPFEDVSHMNEIMILRWNWAVQENDTVYYLGDFAFGGQRAVDSIIYRLNGTIMFLPGSHDGWMKQGVDRFEKGIWSKHSFLPPLVEVTLEGQKIVLCHYAMRSWPSSFHGSFQLYGHSHGRLESNRQPRQMDVGVDCHDFYPVSLKDIVAKLSKDKEPPGD